MKKEKKISLFIIMFVIISLAVILFSNPLFMNKILGNISGNTNYYDWGDLQSIDNDYSYSTLIYTENTKIYNTWSSNNPNDIEMTVRQDVIDDNDVDDDTITKKTNVAVFKIKEEDVSAGFVITNCAIDKDGNLLDAIVTVNAEELWEENSFILFTLDRTYLNSGTQPNPDFATGIDRGIIKKTVKKNTPLSFFLSAEKGRASVNLTYYKSLRFTNMPGRYVQPANYNIGGASSSGNTAGVLYSPTIDYNNSPVATSITKVNSFYYDIDVPRTYADKLQSGREGVLSKSGQNNIYYKKDNDIAFNETITFNKYVNGLFINKNTIYSTGTRNINGIWYATSTEFLTSLPSSSGGSYDFDYIGSSCGLWFMFFSPMGYTMEDPTLEAPSVAYTGETWNYVSKQYVPNNFYSNIVNFHDVYSNFPKDNYINSFVYKIFKNSISSELTTGSSTLKDINGNSISGKFYKPSGEEYYTYVPKSSATDYFKTNSAYNNSIVYTIPVVAETPTETPYDITNKSNVSSTIGDETSVSRDSNEVTTTIKSPSVIYDCETNGGTGNKTTYYNVEDQINLNETCTHTSQTFLGWALTPTINSSSDLVLSKTIPTAAELHADNSLEVTTLYGIYTKAIEINARNESKVYDGTTLNASDNTTYGGGKCYANSGLQTGHYIDSCTYTQNSSITNYGTTAKEISTVRIVDGDNNDVTNLYNPSFIAGTLEITKRNIIVQAIDQQKHYDGTPLEATETGDYACVLSNETPYQLVSGHTLTCVSTGSRTDVGGEDEKEKEITGVDIYQGSIDVHYNYNVTTENADLIVTESLCPSATNYSGIYDGNSHTIIVGTSEGTVYYRTSTTGNWTTTLPTRTNAGTTTVYMQAEKDGQVTTCPNKKIKVTKRSIKVAAISQSKVYDGNPLTATEDGDYACVISSTSATQLVRGHILTCTSTGSRTVVGGTGLNEKEITSDNVTITQGTTNVTANYTITTENADLIVTKANSVCPTVTNYTGTYDGNNHTITINGGEGGTIYYRLNSTGSWKTTLPQVKNAGTTTVNIKITGDSNHNNKTCPSGTITIEKRIVEFKAKNQSKVYDGYPLEATEGSPYKCTLNSGELVSGDKFNCVSSGSIINVGTEVKNIDSVTINDSNNNNVTDNYIVSTIPGELKVTKANAVCPTVTDYSGTYDGDNHTVTISGGDGGTIEYRKDSTVSWNTTLPTRDIVGTTEVQIRVQGDNNHNDVSCPSNTITIIKRPVTYKADSDSKVYDGTPLTKQSASLISGSLVNGHNATFSITGTITNVGTENNVLNSVTIKAGETDVSGNYEITRENGVLEITSATSTCPRATSYEGVYDGNSHTITVGSTEGGSVQYRESDNDNWSTTLPTRTNQGITTVQIRVKGDENHDDETCPSKTITINKRPITIKATNQSKPYDGSPLEATEDSPYTCTKESGELVSGSSFICVSTGSITNVGEADKVLDRVMIKDNNLVDVTDNYDITKINAKLIITKVDAICPEITDYSGIYDGNSHTITVGSITTGEITYKSNDSNEWTTVLPRRTNYGETTINIKVTGDNNHNDVVCPNGKIKINKRPITVTTTNETKEYDGEPLIPTNNTCSIKTGISLANNERLTGCTTSGTQTNVGESDKTITSIIIKGTNDQDIDLNNYDITYEKGKLIITGEFEPIIVKNVISTKRYYRFNDTVRYKITITNTANYSIKNIKVRENNINARFVEGTGYTLLSNQLVNVISINPLSSINIYAEYKVGKTETNKVDNEVEIISAESDIGATLKDEEYKDTATFGIQSKIRICKNISGVSIPNKFQFKVTGIENGFGSDVSLNKDECINVYVDPGKYKVTEIIPEEYEIVSVSGAISSNGGIINVVQGQDYEVTFTNKYTQKVYFHGYGRRENKVEGGE